MSLTITAFDRSPARLALHPVAPADRAALVALEADPGVVSFLNGGQLVPEVGVPDGSSVTPRGDE